MVPVTRERATEVRAALLDRVAPLVDGLDVASAGELAKALAVKPAGVAPLMAAMAEGRSK